MINFGLAILGTKEYSVVNGKHDSGWYYTPHVL